MEKGIGLNGAKLGRPRLADYERARELRARGLSLRQIGRELGCDRSTVSKVLKNGRRGEAIGVCKGDQQKTPGS